MRVEARLAPAHRRSADAIAVRPAAVKLEVSAPDTWSRWLPLARPVLVMPHLVLGVLFAGLALAGLAASSAAVLVTGRYPRPLFGPVVGLGRWLARLGAYAWMLTDAYPPLTPRDVPGHPVRLSVPYPDGGRVERWRPLAGWLLVVPHTVYLGFLYVGLLLLLPAVVLSICTAGRFPETIRSVVAVTLDLQARITAYVFLVSAPAPGLHVDRVRRLLLRLEGSWWLTRVAFVWIPMMVPAGWFAARGVHDLGGLAMTCVAAGCAGGLGSVLNDILDAEKDRTTAPALPLPSGVVSLPQATATAGVLGSAFIVLLALASASAGAFAGALGIAVGVALLLSLYSPAKRYALPPLVIVGLLYASIPLIAWVAAGGGGAKPIVATLAYAACFGMGVNALTALQDIDADPGVGNRSIAARLGVRGTLLLAATLDAACVACVLAVAAQLERLDVGVPAAALSALAIGGSYLHTLRSERAARSSGRDARLDAIRALSLSRLTSQVALLAVFSLPAALAIAALLAVLLSAAVNGYQARIVRGGLRRALAA